MPDPTGLTLGAALQVGSAAVGAVKGVADFFSANSEMKRAEEERKKLVQPFYKIQNEYFQNRNIAASNAESGLPESTKNYLTQESQRGFGTALGATQANGGMGGNDAGRLYDTYLNHLDKTAAEDAQAKIGNINMFMTANKDLAGQKTTKWALDEYKPYERKLKEITQRIAAAKMNKNNALNMAIGSAGAAGTALSNNDLMNKLFPSGGSGGAESLGRVAMANPSLITSNSVRSQGATVPPININNYNNSNEQQGDGFDVFGMMNSTNR